MKMLQEEDDMALKILHTADWHLGLRFASFDEEDQPKLTRARLEVVERLMGEAEQAQVDAVLCAGDLFDDPMPDKQWWTGLAELFQKRQWRDRPVFLLPGNHDPLTRGSVYESTHGFRRSLPDWVHVVDRDDFEFKLSDDAILHAIPCRSKAGEDDLASRLPKRGPDDARIRVGMVHGQTFDMEGHQSNFPIDPRAAADRGFDYLALGDTHRFRCVTPEDQPPVVYPGAPEATKFGETGAGSAALVYFRRAGRRPLIDQRQVGRWRWRSETCRDLTSLRNLQHGENLATTVMRLVLDFQVTLNEFDEVNQILDSLKGTAAAHGRIGIMQIDRSSLTHAEPSADEFGELPEILETVVKRLERADQPEVAKRALFHLFKLVKDQGKVS